MNVEFSKYFEIIGGGVATAAVIGLFTKVRVFYTGLIKQGERLGTLEQAIEVAKNNHEWFKKAIEEQKQANHLVKEELKQLKEKIK